MFKKIFNLFLLFITPLMANQTLDILRAQKVAYYIENEYKMKDRFNSYIIKTADTTPTRGEIQSLFGLGEDFWDNYEKERCPLSGGVCVGNVGTGVNLTFDTSKKTISLSNTLGTSPNSYVIQAYTNDNDNERNVDGSYSATFPMSIEAGNMLDLVEKLASQPNTYVGTTPPSDTNLIWYAPDGKGGLTINKYNPLTGEWDSIGSTASAGKGEVLAKDETELQTIPCLVGDKGFTENGDMATPYLCISDGTWKKILGGGEGSSLFNGQATILDIITKKMSSAGGSTASCSAPNSEFTGVKDFIKKDSTLNSGYWVAENMYIATSDMESLMSQNWALNSYGWLPRSNNTSLYTLQVRNVPSIGNRWVYIAYGYSDVSTNFNDISDLSGGYVYDATNNEYFTKSANVWTNIDGDIKLTSGPLSRNEFNILNSSITYYTTNNDCDMSTCNGVGGTYAGVTHDNMYVFYYSTSGNRKNNLIDAIPRASMTEIYNNADAASLYNGYVFLKDVDNRGRLCYKRTSDSKYVTKSNVVIPTTNNMPPADAGSCSNATYSGSAIVLTNRTEMTNWTDAPLSAQVYTASKTYTFTNGTGNDHYWKSATEWVTNGSRSDFDVATSSSIVFLSKQVGTEPNYTGTGVTASVDSSFKQWFYSLTGTVTNNMLDGIPTANAYLDSNAISVGYAIQSGMVLQRDGNYWKELGTNNYKDSSLVTRSTSNIVAIGTASQTYWTKRSCTSGWTTGSATTGQYKPNDASISNCSYNAAAKVYYNDAAFSRRSWSQASSLCSSLGMSMMSEYHTTIHLAGGIAYDTSGAYYDIWTSTKYCSFTNALSPNGKNCNFIDSNTLYVRCVHE